MSLGQPGSEGEGFADVLFFQIRKILKHFCNRPARCECLYNHPDSYSHSANAGFPPHNVGVHRDAVELLHGHMIAH